jgi:hypothetical protein
VAGSADWKQLKNGVKAALIWESIGPKWPQSVLLQLDANEYATLLHDPVRYVNDLKVLGTSSTHEVKFCLKAKVEKGTKDTVYFLTLLHEPGTTVHVLCYEVSP